MQLLCLIAFTGSVGAYAVDQAASASRKPHYVIEVDLDYAKAAFTGRQTVRVFNTTNEDLESIYFNLYPNIGLSEEDEPWMTILRAALGSRELKHSYRSRYTVLKVDLPARLSPGRSVELTLAFAARIPRVQREETSLLAHFLQEVNDAVSDERLVRDARDIFFAGDEAMLLGYFHPVLAMRPLQAAEQNLAAGASGVIYNEIADYRVQLKTSVAATIIASGERVHAAARSGAGAKSKDAAIHSFSGDNLRGFAIAIAERVKSVEQKAGDVRVVSYYREGDERLGKRALGIVAKALEIYSNAFGAYPYPSLQVIQFPLPAGYSAIDFPALIALAQAYYIDFDAPQAARLPGVLREQADVIKSSFEFSLAHAAANQWWGGVVCSDPERAPFVDEALATYSAAYYHEAAYNRELGETIIEQQLRGAYQAYRMLGGVDQEVDKPLKDFKNALQYTAIVQAKGALLLVALRKELGDEKFFNALRYYYSVHKFRVATQERLRYALMAGSEDPRVVRTLFQRWLREKHGDEDIGAPDLTLLPAPVSKMRTLGRVFIKIGKTAAKPF